MALYTTTIPIDRRVRARCVRQPGQSGVGTRLIVRLRFRIAAPEQEMFQARYISGTDGASGVLSEDRRGAWEKQLRLADPQWIFKEHYHAEGLLA